MYRHWLVGITVLGLAAACQPETGTESASNDDPFPAQSTDPSSRQAPPPSEPLSTFTTSELKLPPDVATLVDALAKYNRIESAAVGAGGSPSEVHAAFEKLAAKATESQALSLLTHESAVVRGYMAGHVLRTQPQSASAIYPLLADATSVDTLQGCMGGAAQISNHVGDELRNALDIAQLGSTAHSELGSLALRGAADATLLVGVRSALLSHAARAGVKGATNAALKWLSHKRPELLEGGLVALFLSGADNVLAEVTPFARHSDPSVRRAAASVLGHIPGPKARALLSKLETDSKKMVQTSASMAAKRHPENARADILAALATSDQHAVALGLGRLGNTWAAELLLEHARTSATAAYQLGQLRPTTDPAVIAVMTQASKEPGTDDTAVRIRGAAARFLERSGATTPPAP